jgi:hypothetical protein
MVLRRAGVDGNGVGDDQSIGRTLCAPTTNLYASCSAVRASLDIAG